MQAMKECRALQAEMLATLQSFKASVEKRQEAPSTRESSPSQDRTLASHTDGSQVLAPYSNEEEAEASDQNSREEGEDSDFDSEPRTRQGGHFLASEDMEGLLKAIYTSEGIQGDLPDLRLNLSQYTSPLRILSLENGKNQSGWF